MNELIKSIFSDFKVGGVSIPVKYMYYMGHGEPYVTWMHMDSDNSLTADDALIGYVDYYDFDVYSKSNFMEIVEQMKKVLVENGFVWQPSRSSPDFYEVDTGYYHKTLNFAYMRELREESE